MKISSLSLIIAAITATSPVQAHTKPSLLRRLEGDYLMEECCDKGHGNHDLAVACVSHKTDEYVRMKMMSHSQQMHTLENAMRWKCEVEAPPEKATAGDSSGQGSGPPDVEELKKLRDEELEEAEKHKKKMEDAMEEAGDFQEMMEYADEDKKADYKEKRDKALLEAAEERKEKDKALKRADEYEELIEDLDESEEEE